MKALLYKDLCVIRADMGFLLIFCALSMLPPAWLSFSWFSVVYPGLLLPLRLMGYDRASRWDQLAAMLPYAPRDLVLSRYLLGWGAAVIPAGLLLVSRFFYSDSPDLTAPLWVLAFTLLIQAIFFPVVYHLGADRIISSGLLAVLVVAVAGAVVFQLLQTTLWTAPWAGPVCLVLGAGLSAASVPLSVRQYAANPC